MSMMPSMTAAFSVLRRDLLLAMRRKAEVLTALFFFLIVSSLFPLGIGPQTNILARIAAGVLWCTALFASMLSLDEPVRFVFSHSALREGWDNPNVFVLCMLKQTDSTVSRRQEVGRGLRLAVDGTGERVSDPDVNRLTVVAGESYADFVAALQKEGPREAFRLAGRAHARPLAPIVDGRRTRRATDNNGTPTAEGGGGGRRGGCGRRGGGASGPRGAGGWRATRRRGPSPTPGSGRPPRRASWPRGPCSPLAPGGRARPGRPRRSGPAGWWRCRRRSAFISSSSEKTVSVGIPTELVLGDVFHWQELQAAALLVALPIAFVFNLLLERFVSGFTMGAVKG